MYRHDPSKTPSAALQNLAAEGASTPNDRIVDHEPIGPHAMAALFRAVTPAVFGLCALMAVPVVVACAFAQLNPRWQLPITVAGTVFCLGIALTAAVVFQRARAWLLVRERNWLGSLGFRIEGYFDVLTKAPEDAVLVVRIEASERLPTGRVVEGLAARLGGRVVKESPSSAEMLSPKLLVLASDESSASPNNVAFLRWQRRVLRELATPVHREFAIDRVTFARAAPDEH